MKRRVLAVSLAAAGLWIAAGCQSKIPGAKLHVFRDASHEHHLEKPAEHSKPTAKEQP